MISAISSTSTASVGTSQTQRPSLDDIFKKMDADGSGSISQQEFESAFVSISQKGGNAADAADTAALKAKADAEFKKMDTDGNGQVSAAEFTTAAKAHQAEGAPHGPPPGVAAGGGASTAQLTASSEVKTYDPADTNRDGKVSEQEEVAYEAKQAAQNVVAASAANTTSQTLSSKASDAVKAYAEVNATA